MTKTVNICDCCGMVSEKLFECFKEVRDWRGYKNIPNTWDICQNCIDMLEGAMSREIDSIHGEGMSAEQCIRRIEEVLSRDITISYRPQFHVDGSSTQVVYQGGKETLERLIEISNFIKQWKNQKYRKFHDM